MSQNRVQPGVPSGGEFTTKRRDEASGTLEHVGEGVCSDCGKPTKRSSGLCRRHDPSSKRNRDARPGRTRSSTKGVEKDAPSGPVLDRTKPPLSTEEIGQCDYGFVPVYRSGALVAGQTRDCKNAVVLPATTCHQHGGEPGTSLGRTIAKATAEANRGECFPLAEEHWDAVDQRLAAAQGQLLGILDTDTAALSEAFVRWRNQQGDTPARFSVNNQFIVLTQHYLLARRDEQDPDAAWDQAITLASEPHMTKTAWAKLGRTPKDDAESVAVVWWQPGSKRPDREDGESDDDYEKRLSETPGWRGRHGAYAQFPLSATEGDHYEVEEDPLAGARPSGYGDAPAAISTMTSLATDMGIKVELVDHRPASGAIGYWSAAESKIVVWKGAGDGDDRAVAHVLAHELGHARLGHSTDAQAEDRRADKEVAAESFAALVCAHHGIDSSEVSAFYVDDWRRAAGIDMRAAGLGPLKSAVTAFDDYVTATG